MAPTKTGKCFVCGYDALVQSAGARDGYFVVCEACSEYEISGSLGRGWSGLTGGYRTDEDKELMPFLSAYIARSSERPVLLTDNWRGFAEQVRRQSVGQKIRRVLELFADRSSGTGASVKLRVRKAVPLSGCRNPEELIYFLQHLQAAGQLNWDPQAASDAIALGSVDSDVIVRLTVAGWEAVQPVSGGGVVGTCFMAMSFDPDLDEAFTDGFKPAVETDCGFTLNRVDRTEHNDDITDKIIAGIMASQFVVADFTGQRPGVYFEAGFARGLGREVVWTCRENEKALLHFDTRQFNHVLWTTPSDLRVKLTNRIRSTIKNARLQ